MVKTLEELKNLTKSELLTYHRMAQGHTNDFQNTFGTDYDYNTLIAVIKAKDSVGNNEPESKPAPTIRREPETTKEPEKKQEPINKKESEKEQEKEVFRLTIQRQGNNGSMNLTMTNECKERYKQFVAENGDAYVHTTAALTLYMDLCESGRLEVLSSHIMPKKGKKKSAN